MKYERYIPLALFMLAAIRVFSLNDFSLAHVGALGVLAALTAIFEFKNDSKELQSLKSRLDEQEKTLSDMKKISDDIKSNFNAVKLGQQMRGNISVNR